MSHEINAFRAHGRSVAKRGFLFRQRARGRWTDGGEKSWAMYRIHQLHEKLVVSLFTKKIGGWWGYWGSGFELPWLKMLDTSTRPDLGGLGLPRRNTGDSVRCFSGPSLGQKFVAFLFLLSGWLFPFVSIEFSKKKSWDDFIKHSTCM